ncbi:MAG: hypothetical protein HOP23_02820 [Methylococcaceae bacterium]|nr:hypothetical protein [Methylococcaceae bacterium]
MRFLAEESRQALDNWVKEELSKSGNRLEVMWVNDCLNDFSFTSRFM